MTLRPYQLQGVEHILAHPRSACWAYMGAGKSLITLTALDALYLAGELDGPTLIVAPKRVCESVWGAEAMKWGLDDLAPSLVLGTPKQRARALHKKAKVFCVNFENLPWLVGHLRTWPFACVVVDESSRLRGYRTRQGAKQAHALGRVVFSSERHIQLSGTPAPNGLDGLWGQAWFLDQGERLGKTYTAFLNRWFKQVSINGGQWTRIEPMPHAADEIQSRLADLCLSIDPREYFGVEEPIRVPLYVDLPPEAQRIYQKLEREFFAEIAGNGVEAANAAVKSAKCLQVASGAVIHDSDSGAWSAVHDAKLDALESLVEELVGAPLLVSYYYKSDLARLKQRFPKAEEISEGAIGKWNRGEVQMLLAHPQSAGHGLNLQDGGCHLVRFSDTWNLEHHDQILERIGPTRQAQSGHPRPVFDYTILARGTLDEVVAERHLTKRSVQECLLQAMRR